MITAKNVFFSYRSNSILKNVSFNIEQGGFTAIVGPNGTGKTTLLKLILGDLKPTEGEIFIDDVLISKYKNWNEIGYIAQNEFDLYNNFPATCEEIILASLYSKAKKFGFFSKTEREIVSKVLKLVDMEGFGKRSISKLSGGQFQRIMLACALSFEPKILILDEPTTGLDEKSVLSLYELLRNLNKEMNVTVVMVTHDIFRVKDFAKNIFCLEDGTIVSLDKEQIQSEFFHRHKH